MDRTSPRSGRFLEAIEHQAGEINLMTGNPPVGMRPFFPGISDLSFFGSHVSPAEMEFLAANSPAWDSRTGFDFPAVTGLRLPVCNLGPWGRDYHQRTERVYMPYAFETLPELLWRLVFDFLENPGSNQ